MYVNGGRFIPQSRVINAHDKAYYLHTSFAKCFVCRDQGKASRGAVSEPLSHILKSPGVTQEVSVPC